MEIISNPTQVEIKKAAKALMDGHLVAFPTETVYGLGADATNEKAVSSVYLVKGRPTDHPLIVHISSIKQLAKWAVDIPEYAIKIAKEFWPGPMTLILKRSEIAKDFITGSQENVGVRVSSHPVALALLNEFEKLGGLGIAAPSANRFGAVSPTSAPHVKQDLEQFLREGDIIIDGGKCLVGIESTIIDCTKKIVRILRPGSISLKQIEMITGINVVSEMSTNNVRSPGMLEFHYSPKAHVVLDVQANLGEGFIAMENIPTPNGAIRLSSPNSVEQYAKELYAALRSGDQRGITKIVVIQPKGAGLAESIRDRLGKMC
jgi:L-threonylcarbamoyladenylate synthase